MPPFPTGIIGHPKQTEYRHEEEIPGCEKDQEARQGRLPGMMGDGTEEQNLGQRGNPAARIKKKEVTAAFGKRRRKK